MGTGPDGKGVVLYDVRDKLPTHKTKRYRSRPLEKVTQQYVHHSGRYLAGDPFIHLQVSTRYVVQKRDWPGCPYHYWHPFTDVWDEDGFRVVYRAQLDSTRTYHAGTGPNNRAVAHCLQGNTSSKGMSDTQHCTLWVALHWVAQTLGISPRPFGHCQAPGDGNAKPSCPGTEGTAWVKGFQAGRG